MLAAISHEDQRSCLNYTFIYHNQLNAQCDTHTAVHTLLQHVSAFIWILQEVQVPSLKPSAVNRTNFINYSRINACHLYSMTMAYSCRNVELMFVPLYEYGNVPNFMFC